MLFDCIVGYTVAHLLGIASKDLGIVNEQERLEDYKRFTGREATPSQKKYFRDEITNVVPRKDTFTNMRNSIIYESKCIRLGM